MLRRREVRGLDDAAVVLERLGHAVHPVHGDRIEPAGPDDGAMGGVALEALEAAFVGISNADPVER